MKTPFLREEVKKNERKRMRRDSISSIFVHKFQENAFQSEGDEEEEDDDSVLRCAPKVTLR